MTLQHSRRKPPFGRASELLIKDGIRQARSTARSAARQLGETLKAAEPLVPLGPAGVPLEHAARAFAGLLRVVDHAAADVLFIHEARLPLRSSASYLEDAGPTAATEFVADHYWRYKEWLKRRSMEAAFVHELRLDRAWSHIVVSHRGDLPLAAKVRIARALADAEIISWDTLPQPLDTRRMNRASALAVVLSGEIVARQPRADARTMALAAIAAADEIVESTESMWNACWSRDSELHDWMDLAQRYA
jgi:hypothetical protein